MHASHLLSSKVTRILPPADFCQPSEAVEASDGFVKQALPSAQEEHPQQNPQRVEQGAVDVHRAVIAADEQHRQQLSGFGGRTNQQRQGAESAA